MTHLQAPKPLTIGQRQNEQIQLIGRLMGVLNSKIAVNDEYALRLEAGGRLTFTYAEVMSVLDVKYAEIEAKLRELTT